LNGRSEENLVECCRNGENAAYASLVKAYSGRVFAICLAMLGNSHDAEDVAQQSLLKGLADIKQLQDGELFGAWISRIARNLCIDFIRRRKHEQRVLRQQIAAGSGTSRDYTELEAALMKLPEEYRLALTLYYFDGHSTKAVAEALQISQAAAQVRISRARKKLRNLLKAEGCA